MKATRTMLAALMGLGMAVAAVPAAAGVLETLTDENSEVSIELRGDEIATGIYEPALGMHDWIVDGVRQLKRQWFWGGSFDDAETPLDDVGLDEDSVLASDTDSDGDNDTLFARYLNDTVEVEVRFSLMGGEPGTIVSDITEQIKIKNIGDEFLDLFVYQFCDYDVQGTPYDDIVEIVDGVWVLHDDQNGGVITDTVVAPVAFGGKAGEAGEILDELNDAVPTFFSGPDVFEPDPADQLDAAWVLQWELFIEPGTALIISKDKLITPEPATIGLMLAGGAVTLLARRRRRG